MIIKDVKRIFNSDKICGSYCDFYFGVTFLEHTVARMQHNYSYWTVSAEKSEHLHKQGLISGGQIGPRSDMKHMPDFDWGWIWYLVQP